MAKLRFIGDIHYGKRVSHSTKLSNSRHKLKVDRAVAVACQGKVINIQLGDLFDSYSVSNTELARASHAARTMDYILKGNHDHAHNSFNVSALEDLHGMKPHAEVVMVPSVLKVADTFVHFVPYMPTQKEFLKALNSLSPVKGFCNILVLHTNMYDERFKGSETENNLSADRAEGLTKEFDLVVSGHEHNNSVKYGVHMVGSVMPYSFGDVSGKVCLMFDTETSEVTHQLLWDSRVGYAEVSVADFLEIKDEHNYDFIQITEEIQPAEVLLVVRKMTHLFNNSKVSSIKNNTRTKKDDVEVVNKKESPWQELVSQALAGENKALFLKELEECGL